MPLRIAYNLALVLAVYAGKPLHSPSLPLQAGAPRLDVCSPCVQLGREGIGILLNALVNTGVIGSCGKLCGHLPKQAEQEACTIACDLVGVQAFEKVLNHTDLDPIYFCESVKACKPGADSAKASIAGVKATPQSIAKGDTVQMECDVNVLNATGVGEFRLSIEGPVTEPLQQAFLLPDGIPVGTQAFSVKLTPQDTSGDSPVTWQPGEYMFKFEVCQGECGSKHPHSKVFGQASGTFTLTEAATHEGTSIVV